MDDEYQILLAASGYIIFFGLLSRYIRDELYLPDPVTSLLYGILTGPFLLNLFDTNRYNSLTIIFHFSRLVLSFQVMTIALQLPKDYIYKKKMSLFILLFVVSVLSCLITFLIIILTTGFKGYKAWAIAAACTPTDPVLSISIFHGKFANENIPERIRLLLAAESGLNDGIGIILLFISIDILKNLSLKNFYKFIFNTIFRKTISPLIIGYILGILLSSFFKFCYSNRLVGKTPISVFGIALSLFCMSLAVFLDISEFILIFFTGTAFAYTECFFFETRGSQFQMIIENIFNTSFFIFLGTRVDWYKISLRIIVASFLIICFRRPISIFLCRKWIPDITNNKECFIVGWFGPIGIGALYYSILFNKNDTDIANFIIFVVISSLFLHGLSVPFYKLILRLFGKSAGEIQEHYN